MIQVMLLTLEMERGTSCELELGIYYALKFYFELVKAFGIIYLYSIIVALNIKFLFYFRGVW